MVNQGLYENNDAWIVRQFRKCTENDFLDFGIHGISDIQKKLCVDDFNEFQLAYSWDTPDRFKSILINIELNEYYLSLGPEEQSKATD